MRFLSWVLWTIFVLLFIWVVVQFLAPVNPIASEIAEFASDFLLAARRLGLRFWRMLSVP